LARKKVKLDLNTKFGTIWDLSRAAEEAKVNGPKEEEESKEDDISVVEAESEGGDCIVVVAGWG